MKKRSIKNTRINEEVHRELSNIIRGEIKRSSRQFSLQRCCCRSSAGF